MLNRLFIAIGVLVILAIGAAFVVPRFIQWGDYRERLESMASEVFGTEVAITGDIQLTLLPQPKLQFTKVRVGPSDHPTMEVERVEGEFSLLDFLRDQYKVTRLQIDRPVVNLAIGADGTLSSLLALKADAGQANVSIANADVVDGQLRLADLRSGQTYTAQAVSGQLRLEALSGPFSFQGTATLDGAGYGIRVGTGTFDANGATTLSVYLKADDGSFTVESNGALQAGAAPRYVGDLTYRRPPPRPKEGETADAGRGDFVLQGKLEATGDRVLLSAYTAIPDENRPATRLTGAAEMKLGKGAAFNAVVSGGVMALPPRDATKERADPPYELVRLLSETPLPPIPDFPGTIGLDISELNLRGVSLRDVRLDASTDGQSWTVKSFTAALQGGSSVALTGNLSVVEGHPIFAGGVTLQSAQLDRLAMLWRKPPAGNPLFNMPGSMAADIALSSDRLTLSSGTLVIDGLNQGFDVEVVFGQARSLKLAARLTTLGAEDSAALAALLPDIAANGSFATTFPKGEVDVAASKAVLLGLEATNFAAKASWEGGVLEFTKLAASDYGGMSFDGRLTAFGTIAKPELSGSGTVKIADGAPVVAAALDALQTPPAVQAFLRRWMPADLSIQLDAPTGDGGQTVEIDGRLGIADAKFAAKLTAGVANALTAPIAASLDLTSDSPQLMTAQMGLGNIALVDDRTPLHLAISIDGTPSNSYETHVSLDGGEDHIGFAGNIVPGDFTALSGNGDVDAKLSDASGLTGALGAEGVYVPPFAGKAHLTFEGFDKVELSHIDVGGASGDLALAWRDKLATITGSMSLPEIEARALLPILVGASGTLNGPDSIWPDGPIDIGSAARGSEGRVDIAVAGVTAGGTPLLGQTSFGLDWDAQTIHLRNLVAPMGDGRFKLDVSVCCSNANLGVRQISGRIGLEQVPLDAFAPPPIAATLDGTVDANAAFEASGATLTEAVTAITGTGSYVLTDFSAQHFNPATFDSIGGLTGVVDMAPEAVAEAVTARLQAAPFTAATATGTFTLGGGLLRSPNLAIVGTDARVFGGTTVDLKALTLDARYAMTPVVAANEASAIDSTAEEVAGLATGPLWSPTLGYDVSPLVDGMKIKASEIELPRLEKIRADEEARQKAAEEEQARIEAEKVAAQKAADEEAARLAEEAAAKKAADEAAAKKAADDAAAKKAADDAAKKAAADAAARKASEAPVDLGI